MGPWLVVLDGVLEPYDGMAIETLLKTSEWEKRSSVTLYARPVRAWCGEGFALRRSGRSCEARRLHGVV